MPHWIVTQDESGSSLMHFLQRHLREEMSLRAAKALIGRGSCTINGQIERFASRRLKRGERVSYFQKERVKKVPFQLEKKRILWEDEAVLCYDKPPHFETCGGELEAAMRAYHATLLPVHRLDKETSGILLFAKGKDCLRALTEAFKKRVVEKTYFAICQGSVQNSNGVITFSMAKKASFHGGALWGKKHGGCRAVTEWQRIQAGARASLLVCQPKTGRTHQIRVHLAEIGHPILGDILYGKQDSTLFCPTRQMLHAASLVFPHPISGSRMLVEAALPLDFVQTLSKVGLAGLEKDSHC